MAIRRQRWRNLETGLVREFISPPKRGKWVMTMLGCRKIIPHKGQVAPSLKEDADHG